MQYVSHLFPTKLKHKISNEIFLTYMDLLNKLFGLPRKFMLHFFFQQCITWSGYYQSHWLPSAYLPVNLSVYKSFFAGCLIEGTKVCVPFLGIVIEKDQRNRTFPLKNRIILLSSEWQFGDGFKRGFFIVVRKQLSGLRVI